MGRPTTAHYVAINVVDTHVSDPGNDSKVSMPPIQPPGTEGPVSAVQRLGNPLRIAALEGADICYRQRAVSYRNQGLGSTWGG